ncbi:MAG TPA: 50S ribosomal protein L13 [Longimicrobiales bacterium]|nr:50S ribosomal protein L13 [Longimicrobiales bacterium]
MKTFTPNATDVTRKWFVVDAEGKVLGRLASEIAQILRGKHKPMYATHVDTGDFVVVINAEKVRLTGAKEEKKEYFRHTGYMGGEKFIPFKTMIAEHPERVIDLAVKGMLPKNNLGRLMRRKLKVYAGPAHPHEAQQPQPLEF